MVAHFLKEFSLDRIDSVAWILSIARLSKALVVYSFGHFQSLSIRGALLSAKLLLGKLRARVRVRFAHMSAKSLGFGEGTLLADGALEQPMLIRLSIVNREP